MPEESSNYKNIVFNCYPNQYTLNGPKELVPDGLNYNDVEDQDMKTLYYVITAPMTYKASGAAVNDAICCVSNIHINTDISDGLSKLDALGFDTGLLASEEDVDLELDSFYVGHTDTVLEDFVSNPQE